MDNKIVIFSKLGCLYCARTRTFFKSLNLQYTEINLNPNDNNYEYKKDRLFKYYNHNSYPIIVIDNKLIGGHSELLRSYDSHKLHKICNDINLFVPFDN